MNTFTVDVPEDRMQEAKAEIKASGAFLLGTAPLPRGLVQLTVRED
jgi:hypothetical protein